MSQQLQITGGAKVRSLEGVITGSTGVLGSLPINASNGIPQLDVNGKILVSQLPNSVMEYKGTWNAATNTPTLADGTGNQGDVYLCNVAGTVNFGSGPISFVVGDQVIYSGTIWQKASGATGTVTSVAVTESGDALSITGSPITTSGTINIGFAGTSAQYVAGDGSLITFPSIVTEAQKLVTEVYNNTGATLTKGTVVYINGGQGNLPTITKAIATGDSTSAQTYGVVQSDITNMNNGFVVVIGALNNIDTQAYTAGTQLYLSSTTAGAWTDVKQYAPAHLVYVGIVVRSHPTQGVVEIRIQNGFEMDELHNVAAQSPSNGSILQYVSSTALWTSVAGTTTNIAEGTNLYFTDARARAALSATTPLSYNNTTGAFSISQATTSTSGFLSSTDWNTFNNKQNALTNPITGTGVSGRIPYFNGTTTQTSSANLTWDNTNSILGTTSILATTDVAAYNLTINGIDFGKIQNITGQSWGLAYASSGASNALGSSALVWNTTGNVIIINKLNVGNYNNTYNLDITGTARISGQLTLGSTITNGTFTYTLPGATGTFALTSGSISNGTLVKYQTSSGTFISSDISNSTSGLVLINGSIFANTFVRNGGTGSQFLKADGTVDSNTYLTTSSAASTYLPLSGGTLTGALNGTSATFSGAVTSSVATGNGSFYINNASLTNKNWTFIPNTNGAETDLLLFYTGTGAGTKLTIASTGNVGIGTSSPVAPLEIYKTSVPYLRVNDGTRFLNVGVDGTSVFFNTASFYRFLLADGTSEAMRITSGGNVGIGTTSPSGAAGLALAINGGASQTRIALKNSFTGDAAADGFQILLDAGSADVALEIRETGSMRFATSDTERMRITSGGLLLIGTTSTSGVDKVRINNDGVSSYSTVNITNANSTANFYVGVGGGSVANSNLQNNAYVWNAAASSLVFGTSDSARLTISSTGAATFSAGISAGTLYLGSLGTGTVYSSSGTLTNTNPSDKRLKDNITPIAYGLNEVLQLNPVSFDWKNDNNKNKQFGFIAQEVQEVMPEAVIEGEYLGLEKDAIYTALVNAIKELKKEIDELKNK